MRLVFAHGQAPPGQDTRVPVGIFLRWGGGVRDELVYAVCYADVFSERESERVGQLRTLDIITEKLRAEWERGSLVVPRGVRATDTPSAAAGGA